MDDLAAELRRACQSAAKNDRVVTIHLFGIRNAERLKGVNLKFLAERWHQRHIWNRASQGCPPR